MRNLIIEFIETRGDEIRERVIDAIESDCTEVDTYEMYDEMLDEVYDDPNSPSWYSSPSKMMKTNDPIMYETGHNDYCDSLRRDGDYAEVNEVFYDRDEAEDVKEEVMENLSDIFREELDDFMTKVIDIFDI